MTDMTVANEILRQLGGARFRAMVGAREALGTANSLTVKLGRFSGVRVTHVEITLDPTDTYSVRFLAVRAGSAKVLAQVQDVYAESLRTVFTQHTGLATSL